MSKDPGIPNLLPFKGRLLEEIETSRKRKADEAFERKEVAKAQRLGKTVAEDVTTKPVALDDAEESEDDEMDDTADVDMSEADENPMAALLASAQARATAYSNDTNDGADASADEDDDEWSGIDEANGPNPAAKKDSSRRAFDKVFKDVVETSDVVLYVLDARDPNGTRSVEVERQVMEAASDSKRLILILNKIDLIPPPVLKAWLAHLRRSFPTLALRASTPAANARTFDHKALTVKATAETLLRALKSYAHSSHLKRAISVGVIGYPNVGKSSVINALTSRLGGKGGACPVGAEAGVTTSMREVKIDNKLKLLDSPGIVFPSSGTGDKRSKAEEQARLILLNAIPPKEIHDPVPAVSLLLKRLSATPDGMDRITSVYGLVPLMSKNGDLTTDFLVQVARKRGRLGKGGVPNMYAAAQTVVTDWRDGRIQGWTEAPELPPSAAADTSIAVAANGLTGDQKQVVTEWAKEFSLEGLWGDETGMDIDA